MEIGHQKRAAKTVTGLENMPHGKKVVLSKLQEKKGNTKEILKM